MAYTNRVAAPALAGQGVLVTLDATDSAALLPILAVGTRATVGQNIGTVCKVDALGKTFEVNPLTSRAYWESTSTPGQLAVSATITIG
jgi:hypothetical protein